MRKLVFLSALLLTPSLACAAGTGNVVAAFKLEGDGLKRVVDPGPNAIVAKQHYVSIAIDEVRIHAGKLPKPLALLLKVSGALPNGGDFQAILGMARRPDDDGYYKFDRPAVLSPFVYKGQPLVIEVALAPCTEAWAEKIEAAKKVWGAARHIDPNAHEVHAVDATHLGADGSDQFKASFATKEDPTSLPLVAGKYVVISHPKANEIADKVTFDERGLVWKGKDEVVKGVSFATFFLHRRKRGPRRDNTDLEAAKRNVDAAIVAGKTDEAKTTLGRLPDLIEKSPFLTDPEKELEKAKMKIFELRIERRAAKDAKDKPTMQSKTDDLVAALNDIRKKFGDMLEPSEVSQMQYQIRRYLRERDE